MTTDRETLRENMHYVEHRINDFFISALGESPELEITKTVRNNDLNRMNLKT